jgi:hypothetical protein
MTFWAKSQRGTEGDFLKGISSGYDYLSIQGSVIPLLPSPLWIEALGRRRLLIGVF